MWGLANHRFPYFGEDLSKLRHEMDRMLGGVDRRAACCVFPPINIYDDNESFIIRAELPGIKAADLDIQATGTTVTIKGERRAEPLCDGASSQRKERDFGVFARTVELSSPIDADKIRANLELGVLTIVAPKAADSRPRQIKID